MRNKVSKLKGSSNSYTYQSPRNGSPSFPPKKGNVSTSPLKISKTIRKEKKKPEKWPLLLGHHRSDRVEATTAEIRPKKIGPEYNSRLSWMSLGFKCESLMHASRLRRMGKRQPTLWIYFVNHEEHGTGTLWYAAHRCLYTPACTEFMWHREPRVCVWIRDEIHPYLFLYDHNRWARRWNCMPDVAREPTLLQHACNMDATSGMEGPRNLFFLPFPPLTSPNSFCSVCAFAAWFWTSRLLQAVFATFNASPSVTRHVLFERRSSKVLLSPTRGLEASGITDWKRRVKIDTRNALLSQLLWTLPRSPRWFIGGDVTRLVSGMRAYFVR